MNELKQWLEEQIAACQRSINRMEKQPERNDTKMAEYWFSKLAYENTLKELIDIQESTAQLPAAPDGDCECGEYEPAFTIAGSPCRHCHTTPHC